MVYRSIGIVVVFLISFLAFTHTNHTEAQSSIPYKVEEVVSNLYVPWGTVFTSHIDDNNWRMLVTERNGTVQVVTRSNGNQTKKKLYDFPEIKAAQGNASGDPIDKDRVAGLLGLTVDPNYSQNKYVYFHVFWPDGNGVFNARVVRMTDTGTTLNNRVNIVTGIPGDQFHRGGRLGFGDDGFLYISTGDAAQMVGTTVSELHPLDSYPQDINNLGGKVLRVQSNGNAAPGNPFIGSAGDDRIFSYGYRSIVGMDFHPETGELVTVGHGPTAGEKKYLVDGMGLSNVGGDEINVTVKGDNYGWPMMVGNDKSSYARDYENSTGKTLRGPKHVDYIPPGGATFYTGCVFPQFKNHFLYTSLKNQTIYDVRFDGTSLRDAGVSHSELSGISAGRLRDIIEGPDGYIYFSTSNDDGIDDGPNPDGNSIYRLVPQGNPQGACSSEPTPTTKSPTPTVPIATPTTPVGESDITVCSSQGNGCDFVGGDGLQQALETVSNNGDILIKSGTYTRSSFETYTNSEGHPKKTAWLLDRDASFNLKIVAEDGAILSGSGGNNTGLTIGRSNRITLNNFTIDGFKWDNPCRIGTSSLCSRGVGLMVIGGAQSVQLNGGVIKNNDGSGINVNGTAHVQPYGVALINNGGASSNSGIFMHGNTRLTGESVLMYGNKRMGIGVEGTSVATLRNATIAFNGDGNETAGAYVNDNAQLDLVNTIIYKQNGHGVMTEHNGLARVSYSTIDSVSGSAINQQGSPVTTENMLNQNPQFVNEADRDFHLSAASPLRDQGLPNLQDPDGSRSDIGSYGGPFACNLGSDLDGCASSPTPEPTDSGCAKASQGDLDCSGIVNALDLTILLTKFGSNDETADLDDSGVVNALDLSLLLVNFGK